MRDERPHSDIRRIEQVGVRAPLIVPSFSSCGFPHVAEIYGAMKDKLFGVCLVSALDIASGYVPANVTSDVNLVLVDSGMYEARNAIPTQVDNYPSTTNAHWSRRDYSNVVGEIEPSANVILVNYDRDESIERQISHASQDFSHVPHAASDFLVKPEPPARLVNVAKLAKRADDLQQFDMVGITAREAGNSVVDRCRTVVMLRDALGDVGLETPIHVFGAINPVEVLTYFLCGADVFDGLNWLRLSFRDVGSLAIDEAAFDDLKSNLCDFDLWVGEWLANLHFLYRLQEALRRYGLNRDLDELVREMPSARKAAYIAERAGAVIYEE